MRTFQFALCLVALSFSGCGFHLRGTVPGSAQNLYLEGIGSEGPFAMAFDRAMSLAGGKSVSSLSQANGVIHIYRFLPMRRALTLGRFGRANEFDLGYRLVFDVRTPKGEVMSQRQEIELHRDYFNDQTMPLALLEEEGLIRQEMQKEIAQALVRRATYVINAGVEPKS